MFQNLFSTAGIHLVWTSGIYPHNCETILEVTVGVHQTSEDAKEQGSGSHEFTLISQHSKKVKGPADTGLDYKVESVWTNHEELALNNRVTKTRTSFQTFR